MDISLNSNDIIKLFCSSIEEFEEQDLPEYTLFIKDDIYNHIVNIDRSYASEALWLSSQVYGLVYISTSNKFEIYIKKQDGVNNIIFNLYHETIHVLDFYRFCNYFNEKNYRIVYDKKFFILWSEFHATYLTYLYLLKMDKQNVNPLEIKENTLKEIEKFCLANKVLEINKTTDFFVRQFGIYIALYELFPDVIAMCDDNLFINSKFKIIYKYLLKHREFDSVKNELNRLEVIFRILE